jgi:hypothetical protein
MKRRNFLASLGSLAAVPLLLKTTTGCDDGAPTSGGAGTTTTGGDGDGDQPDGFRVFNTDDTHPHSFVVVCTDEGEEEVTYTATGSAHTHRVTLTGEQLAAVFAGEEVIIETDDSHPHTWSVMMPDPECSGPAEPPPDLDTLGGW